jgi:hypothetical protein
MAQLTRSAEIAARAAISSSGQLRDPVPDLGPHTSRALLSYRRVRLVKAAAAGGRI